MLSFIPQYLLENTEVFALALIGFVSSGLHVLKERV